MQIMKNLYTSLCTWPLSNVRNTRKCSLEKVRDKWILQGNKQKSSMAQTLIMQICMNTLLIKQTKKDAYLLSNRENPSSVQISATSSKYRISEKYADLYNGSCGFLKSGGLNNNKLSFLPIPPYKMPNVKWWKRNNRNFFGEILKVPYEITITTYCHAEIRRHLSNSIEISFLINASGSLGSLFYKFFEIYWQVLSHPNG